MERHTVLSIAVVILAAMCSKTDTYDQDEEQPDSTNDDYGNCEVGLWSPTENNDTECVNCYGLWNLSE